MSADEGRGHQACALALDRARSECDRLRKTVRFVHDCLDDVEATSAGAVLRTIEQATRHALVCDPAARAQP